MVYSAREGQIVDLQMTEITQMEKRNHTDGGESGLQLPCSCFRCNSDVTFKLRRQEDIVDRLYNFAMACIISLACIIALACIISLAWHFSPPITQALLDIPRIKIQLR